MPSAFEGSGLLCIDPLTLPDPCRWGWGGRPPTTPTQPTSDLFEGILLASNYEVLFLNLIFLSWLGGLPDCEHQGYFLLYVEIC